jgi:hypothetical protein
MKSLFSFISKIALIIVVLALSACISHKQYRPDYSLCISASPEQECQNSSLQQYNDPQSDRENYMLGFVEFDDQGQLWDRSQLNQLIEQLSATATAQDVLVVVFVHGWKHSAKVGDTNIKSFRRTLRRLSAMESAVSNKFGKKPREIAGVYLGWRGGSVSFPIVKEMTFWDRKSTAHKVGYGGATEALSRLDLFKTTKQAIMRQDDMESSTRLVVIGHSFGGAVVYSAVSEILEKNFVQTQGPVTVNSNSMGFSDLVVLINPAFEAARYSSLSDMSTERGTYFSEQLPALAVLTSEADLATKIAFPAGRYFSTVFEKERDVLRKNPVVGQNEMISQGKANVTALGHFNSYKTHYLEATSKLSDDDEFNFDMSAELDTFLTVSDGWENDHPGSKIDFTGSSLTRSLNSAGRNPYLNIRVDQELISDHNDIEDPRIESFIRQLILISTKHNESESHQ